MAELLREAAGTISRQNQRDKVLIPEAEHACLCLERGQQPGVMKVHQQHGFWINIYSFTDDRMKLCGDLGETRRQKERKRV